MSRVQIPPTLACYADGRDTLDLPAATVREALLALRQGFPELGRHLLKEDGSPRTYVNVYVNEADIRALSHLDTALAERDTLTLVPCIAGG